jgi:hypothetical protein
MFKYANFMLILATIACSQNNNDYINLNQLEMKTDTSLLKARFKENLAEYANLQNPVNNVHSINLDQKGF